MVSLVSKVKINREIIKSIERSPVPLLGIDYKVKIVYKNINITELDINNKIIKISLPNKFKKMQDVTVLDIVIEKMYEQIAIVEIERAMEKYRVILGIAPEEFLIKNIKKLANCRKNVITINPKIVTYNREVIDYIVLRQYCNLKYKVNSKEFLKLIKKYKPNYRKCEEILMKI